MDGPSVPDVAWDPVGGSDLEFGHLLRSWRTRAGLTIEELAQRAGSTKQTVQELETLPTRVPYPSTVRAVSSALQLTAAQTEALLAAATARKAAARIPASSSVTPPVPRSPTVGETTTPPATRRRDGRWAPWWALGLTAALVACLVAVVVVRGSRDNLPVSAIDLPADGSRVDSSLDVRGRSRPAPDERLWLVIKPGTSSDYVVTDRTPISLTDDGSWTAHVTVGRGPGDRGTSYDLYLVAVPHHGQLQQAVDALAPGDYLHVAADAFPPTDSRVVDRVTVTLGRWAGR